MSMDLKDKRGVRRFFLSFTFASRGLVHVIRHEQNMKLHVFLAAIVIIMAFLLRIPAVHWLVLLLVIAGMFSLEIMNTAIERVVDLITDEYRPLAGLIKDISAAAVFIYSIMAVVIGAIIFWDPFISFLTSL